MLTTSRPAIGEYALAVADYVAAIGEDEDVFEILALWGSVIAGHTRHHMEVVAARCFL